MQWWLYRDYEEGENNMNEEWFGICAKGPTNERGLYELYPRAAYYALKEAHQLNPYDEGVNLDFVDNYFSNINLMDAVLRARGDKAALGAESGGKIRLSNLRAEFTTFNTGGSLITTPDSADPDEPNTILMNWGLIICSPILLVLKAIQRQICEPM